MAKDELLYSARKMSLLSDQARVQVPWIKITIGDYTFGVFNKETRKKQNSQGFYESFNVTYPNYIQKLQVVKINGQVNQYTLDISYPVTQFDDPNFFEKVFSTVSSSRKIIFSYGDASKPTYIYKDEEAIITKVSNSFDIRSAVINYTVKAVSSAALTTSGNFTFINNRPIKPSDEIKRLFKDTRFGLQDIFTGMSLANIDDLIDGSDLAVEVGSKTNISALDYITYLVSCMLPDSSITNNVGNDIYILTIHDDTVYDKLYSDSVSLGGPYFKVTRVSSKKEQSDAYNIDIGINTSTIVTNFSITNDENFSILYDYQSNLNSESYTERLTDSGDWEKVYAPAISSKNEYYVTWPDDVTWWTKITKFPIGANLTIQGLLRPAQLMTYVRLNVIFPGGHKHISSGLYIITKQVDTIDGNGYRTDLALTRIGGDDGAASTI